MELTKNKLILRPLHFTLQWHITERCNWNCRHCYRPDEPAKKELPLKNLLEIFKQYLNLLEFLGKSGPHQARLSLTGGEPLLRDDLFLFLEKIHRHTNRFSLSILTNGSLIDKECAKRLKNLGVRVVQVSLEGATQQNDYIRSKGAFEKTVASLNALGRAGIVTVVSFTIRKSNVLDIPQLIKLCKDMRVSRLGLRRLVPLGRAQGMPAQLLSPKELRTLYLSIQKEERQLEKEKSPLMLARGCEEGIFSQETDYPTAACAIAEGRVLVVLPDGDVLPCRRLPIRLGNALEEDLVSLYYNSKVLTCLRNLNNAHPLCKECPHFNSCLGGARCVSYAYFHNPYAPDPQCWRLFDGLPGINSFNKKRSEPEAAIGRISFRLFTGLINEKA
ncbi:MAG: radical SAM protein [Candidatus Omnitrophota bacterium]|jgi:radical SAM protein with 4Fe4S-binding SPASM domain